MFSHNLNMEGAPNSMFETDGWACETPAPSILWSFHQRMGRSAKPTSVPESASNSFANPIATPIPKRHTRRGSRAPDRIAAEGSELV